MNKLQRDRMLALGGTEKEEELQASFSLTLVCETIVADMGQLFILECVLCFFLIYHWIFVST